MRVLVVGEASVDTYLYVDGFPKEGGSFSLKEKIECPGGNAYTSAILLSKWGVDTFFSGVIGEDYEGEELIKYAQKNNLNTDYINNNGIETLKKYIVINRYNTSSTVINSIDFSDISKRQDYKEDIDIILIDSYNYNLVNDAIERYPNAIKVLNANLYNDNTMKLCSLCDYIICTKEFAELASKVRMNYRKPDTLKQAINYLDDIYTGKIVITLKEKGCLYKNEDKTKIMGAIKVKEKDTTSTKDVFNGAFVYGLSKNLPIEKCLKIATIAAGLSARYVGSTSSIPDVLEVYKVYEKNK